MVESMNNNLYLTANDLMKILQVSRQTLYNHLANGMPSHKFGKSRRFLLHEVLEWYKTQAK